MPGLDYDLPPLARYADALRLGADPKRSDMRGLRGWLEPRTSAITLETMAQELTPASRPRRGQRQPRTDRAPRRRQAQTSSTPAGGAIRPEQRRQITHLSQRLGIRARVPHTASEAVSEINKLQYSLRHGRAPTTTRRT
jgi:hypothetical protein